jgi:hypothetical protein
MFRRSARLGVNTFFECIVCANSFSLGDMAMPRDQAACTCTRPILCHGCRDTIVHVYRNACPACAGQLDGSIPVSGLDPTYWGNDDANIITSARSSPMTTPRRTPYPRTPWASPASPQPLPYIVLCGLWSGAPFALGRDLREGSYQWDRAKSSIDAIRHFLTTHPGVKLPEIHASVICNEFFNASPGDDDENLLVPRELCLLTACLPLNAWDTTQTGVLSLLCRHQAVRGVTEFFRLFPFYVVGGDGDLRPVSFLRKLIQPSWILRAMAPEVITDAANSFLAHCTRPIVPEPDELEGIVNETLGFFRPHADVFRLLCSEPWFPKAEAAAFLDRVAQRFRDERWAQLRSIAAIVGLSNVGPAQLGSLEERRGPQSR